MFKYLFLLVSLVHCSWNPKTVNISTKVNVTHLGNFQKSWDDTPIVYPTGTAEVSAYMIEMPVGAETGWHKHPVPTVGYMLQGDLEVSLENGQKHYFKAGDAASEVIDTFHNGKNIGSVPVRIVIFYLGEEGVKTTVLKP